MSETRTSRLAFRCGLVFLVFSALLWIVWVLIGVLSLAIAWRLMWSRGRWLLLLFGLWILATLFFADNLVPVLRGIVRGSPLKGAPPAGTFRVATLNCASSAAAAGEVMRFRPDIILLQESPPSNKVAELAREWFGDTASFVAGFDCSIVSRYPLKAIDERPPVHYTRAILVLNHVGVLVTSLRFTPPLGAMDLWRPATWRAYRDDRRLRREQLQSVLDVQPPYRELPAIIAGDFNAPAGDGIYRLLRDYRDTHQIARGWGGTALNTMPFFRPDQIWLRKLSPVASCAIRTVHSDHRMVIADVR